MKRDDVRVAAGRDGAQRLFHRQQSGIHACRAGKRLLRRHAAFDVQRQVASVLPPHREHGVRAHANAHAGLDGPPHGFHVAVDIILELLRIPGGKAKPVGIFPVVAIVRDCRYVYRAARHHLVQCGFVYVDRMLEGVGAGANGIASPAGSVRVDGDFLAIGVCHLHRRLHLFERERLVRVDVVEAADRSEHLDHVRACSDLLAYGFHHLGRTVRLPSRGHQQFARARSAVGDAQAVTRRKDPRSRHRAAIDQIPHRNIGIFLRAKIAHRGHAGLERLARILLRHEDTHGSGKSHRGLQATDAGTRRGIGPVCDVRMGID